MESDSLWIYCKTGFSVNHLFQLFMWLPKGIPFCQVEIKGISWFNAESNRHYANVEMKGMKMEINLVMNVSEWESALPEWDRCTCKPTLYWSSALVEAAASFISPILRSVLAHSLSHSLYLICWLRYSYKHRLREELQWASSVCMRKQILQPSSSSWVHLLGQQYSLFWAEAVDFQLASWTREVLGTVKGTGSLAGSPDWCTFGPRGMGCTTSTVVFDGLRTVLERNCSGSICKGAAESIGPSEAERALSRRESRVLPTPRVLKVCVHTQ